MLWRGAQSRDGVWRGARGLDEVCLVVGVKGSEQEGLLSSNSITNCNIAVLQIAKIF